MELIEPILFCDACYGQMHRVYLGPSESADSMVKYQKTIEQTAGLALIGAIVVGCAFVLRPFVSAILWAAILCFATWPLHELFLKWLRRRRNLAAALMTALLSLFLIIPFVLVGLTFTDSIRSAMKRLDADRQMEAERLDSFRSMERMPPGLDGQAETMPLHPNTQTAGQQPDPNAQVGLPPPPEWVGHIPWVGESIREYWLRLNENAGPMLNSLRPSLKAAGLWLLHRSLDFATGVLQLAMSVLIAFFLYRDGEGLVVRLREGFQRISGDYAQHLMHVVQTTVRSVVYGVLGTALAQGIVAGIGFVIAGTPAPMMLALLTFFMSFVPFGPPLVWIGASIWLFVVGRTGWGIFLVLYGLFCISSVDNVIKPYIISRGSKLSFIVMFMGVLGGVAAFGFIGIFLGPTLLAVGFSLIQEIVEQRRYCAVPRPAEGPDQAVLATGPAAHPATPPPSPTNEPADTPDSHEDRAH
jgi:predicted PurR-regulated permease PerM